MPTILLVEDQIVFRDNLAEALEDQGYGVIRAGSAEEAVDAIDARAVDLFLLDVALPGQSGLEFLRSMRAKAAYRRIPAFFLTAYARPEAMEEASRLGVGDFLVKSDVSLRDLLERIQRGLAAGSEIATASSRLEPVETRRHIRPALRRWRPVPDRAQVKDLFALATGPCRREDLENHLSVDPLAARWLRKANLPSGDGHSGVLQLLILRATIDAAMRSVQPSQDIRRLWRRALATGLLAAELHPPQAFGSPAEAFLAGLCTQVPWIFAIQALETEYPEVKAEAWEDGRGITEQLAGAFGTDEATLVMETLRGLEPPDRIWKAVVDIHGSEQPSGMWEMGPGGRILSMALQFSSFLEPAWHPCAEVRGIDAAAAVWLRGDPSEAVHRARSRFRAICESDAFPEIVLGDQTRMVPVAATGRRFAYVREPGAVLPDPIENALAQLGEVDLTESVESMLSRDDAVRVAWAEPGGGLWERLRESPRRTLILHHKPFPRGAAPGAHANLQLPAPLALLERAVRGRE